MPVLSKATVASKSPAAYFDFDVIFIYVFISLGYLVVPGGKLWMLCRFEKIITVIFWFFHADNSKFSAARLWDQSPIPRHITACALAAASQA